MSSLFFVCGNCVRACLKYAASIACVDISLAFRVKESNAQHLRQSTGCSLATFLEVGERKILASLWLRLGLVQPMCNW